MTDRASLEVSVAAAIADAAVDDQGWDSLDVLLVLTCVEERTGLQLPDGSYAPGDVTDAATVVELLDEIGVPSPRRARMTLTWDRDLDATERRSLEYRANLASPDARIAVRGERPAELIALATDPGALPITDALRGALGGPPASAAGAAGNHASPALEDLATGGATATAVAGAVRAWVLARGGEVWPAPSPMLGVDELTRLGYLASGDEQLIRIGDTHALAPAVCLPFFAPLTARFADRGLLVTTTGTAFRNEPPQLDPFGRLPAFTVQETMWIGSPDWCAQVSEDFAGLASRLAEDMGLKVTWQPASDAFFLGASPATTFKSEGVVKVDGRSLAVSSVNHHGRHFVDATRPDLPPDIMTCCAGLGLERLLLAAEAVRGGGSS